MLTLLIFAWKDVRHDWVRTLLGISGLAVIFFSYHLMGALSEAIGVFIQDPGVSRNLIVVDANLTEATQAVLSQNAVDAARGYVPELVSRVSPVMIRQLRFNERMVQLRAAAIEDWEPLFHLKRIEGHWPSAPDEVACGEDAARANGWQLGSLLHIYGSDFRISAIFRSQGLLFAAVWIPLERARQLYGAEAPYQAMYVETAPAADIEPLRAKLQADPRIAGQYMVFLEDSYTRRNNQIILDVNFLGHIAEGLALVAIIFGTLNATSLSMVERAREIGCLRAIGFSARSVQSFFMVRSVVQGLLAYALGLGAAGIYTAARASHPIIIYGFPLVFRVSTQQALLGLVWMAGLAVIGSSAASRGLAGRNVAELLRG